MITIKNIPITLITLIGLNTLSIPVSAQIHIKGQIIDIETSEPVIAAHIIKPDSTGTFSGKDGFFELAVTSIPVKLKVRHVSYGESEVTISKLVPDPLIIRIKKQVSQIGEVQVAAQKMRILTEQEDFTLQDFAFDNSYLWMLGYLNNQATKGRLWQANWFGDTIRSIKVRGAEKLERDLLGNAQLYIKDSVFQLFGDNDTAFFAYSYPRNEYESTMGPIHTIFNNKAVYSNLSDLGFVRNVYCIGEGSQNPRWLFSVEDAIGRRDFRLFSLGLGVGPRNMTVPAPLFSLNDSLFIVNVIKDSLLIYGPDGKFVRSHPFTFHRVMVLGLPEYWNFKFSVDPVASSVYIIDNRKNNQWSVVELDYQTGKTSVPVPLPDYPGMTHITPFANAIYFLYTEKRYPYYTRLYRLQL